MANGRTDIQVARRGLMLVLSSPSGAGKTTLSRRLLESDPAIDLSISVTTRRPRPGEVDGRDYHFIDRARFDAMIESGDLLEWAQVFGNGYGTPRAPVVAALPEREKTIVFIPGIAVLPCFTIISNVRRPISSVSNCLKSPVKSISGSMIIQSDSPLGPAMYPSKLIAIWYRIRLMASSGARQ